PNTDIATTTAIRHTGASFVWTEIDEQTYNMDPARIEEKITSRTKAILPVHLYGLPADMGRITSIAKAHNLRVVTDNALAVGARYRGARSAAIGDTGCFSFSYSKGLGTYGDAGMVVTDDPALADMLRSLEIYNNETLPMDTIGKVAILDRFNYRIEGHYTRLVSIHAAILRERLKVLDSWITKRRNTAQLYNRHLSDLDVILPFEPSESEHVFRNFPIRVKERDRVRKELAEGGIPTGVHYAPPLHLQPVYGGQGFGVGSFPTTERVAREVVTLPMHPFLSEAHVAQISTALQRCIE
ncbi:DegT/DnrJ/EryC1/StrS family aminotransferase, partial [Candidatus Bipolaricaulota bacterium]